MSNIKSIRGVQAHFNRMSDDIKYHFKHLETIIKHDDLSLQVALAYIFLKMEQGQNRALYGGATKIHQCDKDIAQKIVQEKYLTAEEFKRLFKNVFGRPIDQRANKKIEDAQKIRNKVVHGKDVPDSEIRIAIADVLDYAKLINSQTDQIAQFRPFGDMTGFLGRGGQTRLPKGATRWLMKGLGFDNIR